MVVVPVRQPPFIAVNEIFGVLVVNSAVAGVARGTYIFCVPGSPGACKDAWTGILRYQFDFRHQPCNMVEIMPRLMEHVT